MPPTARPSSLLGTLTSDQRIQKLAPLAMLKPSIAAEIADYRLAGNSADARLQDLPWPPDLVWLGMGEDGHTASIFAGPDLQAALDALPPDFRAAVVLCDLEGLSYEEIAATLGIKIGTVRSRIHRGRAQLRASLAHRSPAAPAPVPDRS